MSYEIPDYYNPSEAYNRYCQEQEDKRLHYINHGKCKDCRECEAPDNEFKDMIGKIAWCRVYDFFVDPEKHPAYYDCEEVYVQ